MTKRKRFDGPLPALEDVPKPTLFGWLRARLIAGVVIAAPIAISVGIVYWLITVIDARVKPLLPPLLDPETYTNIAIPGVGVLVAILGLILLGAIGTNLIGRWMVQLTERLLSQIPVVSNIYGAFKQLFDILGSGDRKNFKEVVLVEYPKRGTWCLGFVSADAKGELREQLTSDFVGVFVPTTPNPTSGFLMYVNRNELKYLDMSVEDGAKLIISAGLVVPDQLPVREPGQELPQPGSPAPVTAGTSAPETAHERG